MEEVRKLVVEIQGYLEYSTKRESGARRLNGVFDWRAVDERAIEIRSRIGMRKQRLDPIK